MGEDWSAKQSQSKTDKTIWKDWCQVGHPSEEGRGREERERKRGKWGTYGSCVPMR